mgnify:CR=1 FL=1
MTPNSENLVAELKTRATQLGFESFGITAADARPDLPARLSRWLELRRQGDMGWMEETAARRSDPLTLWPDAKSVVMLAMNYGPAENPLPRLEERVSRTVIRAPMAGIVSRLNF